MTVKILFFSVLRDITGTAACEVELPPGASVHDLLADLFARWPDLKGWEASLLIAVDQSYARRATVLHEQAEVAIMPPVQGG